MNKSIAVIAAHPDDEVLGCGASIAKWVKQGNDVNVLLMTDGESSRVSSNQGSLAARQAARETAADRCAELLGCRSLTRLDFPDNRMSSHILLDVVVEIEKFISRHQPGLVLTHHAGDVNVDHRTTHDAVLAACRPQPGHSVKSLMFFEVPSSSEWSTAASRATFWPQYFSDVTDYLQYKMSALDIYEDEMRPAPHSRSKDGVEALARWRGCSAGVEAAEAFMIGRMISE